MNPSPTSISMGFLGSFGGILHIAAVAIGATTGGPIGALAGEAAFETASGLSGHPTGISGQVFAPGHGVQPSPNVPGSGGLPADARLLSAQLGPFGFQTSQFFAGGSLQEGIHWERTLFF